MLAELLNELNLLNTLPTSGLPVSAVTIVARVSTHFQLTILFSQGDIKDILAQLQSQIQGLISDRMSPA